MEGRQLFERSGQVNGQGDPLLEALLGPVGLQERHQGAPGPAAVDAVSVGHLLAHPPEGVPDVPGGRQVGLGQALDERVAQGDARPMQPPLALQHAHTPVGGDVCVTFCPGGKGQPSQPLT